MKYKTQARIYPHIYLFGIFHIELTYPFETRHQKGAAEIWVTLCYMAI